MLAELAERLGGARCLRDCDGRRSWPKRGVYFFFERGETRRTSRDGPRIVRVGTHALKARSSTTLWNRLSQHRGVTQTGGGNHRGSIFRLLVGEAIIRRDALHVDSWGVGQSLTEASARLGRSVAELKGSEAPVEAAVTRHIGDMPFVWIAVDDDPGPGSVRGVIERNAIALLSSWHRTPVDPVSPRWLGQHSGRERVRASGLWNNDHVEDTHDAAFVDMLAGAIARTAHVL
jgi:hypothetical protein